MQATPNPNAPIQIILTLTACAAAAFWWWGLRKLRHESSDHAIWTLAVGCLLMLLIPPLAAWTLSSLWLWHEGLNAQAPQVAAFALAVCVYGLLALLPPRSRLQTTSTRVSSGYSALAFAFLLASAALRWLTRDSPGPWLGAVLLVAAGVSLLLAHSTRARVWLAGLWNPPAH
jgi:hypothetical protein